MTETRPHKFGPVLVFWTTRLIDQPGWNMSLYTMRTKCKLRFCSTLSCHSRTIDQLFLLMFVFRSLIQARKAVRELANVRIEPRLVGHRRLLRSLKLGVVRRTARRWKLWRKRCGSGPCPLRPITEQGEASFRGWRLEGRRTIWGGRI